MFSQVPGWATVTITWPQTAYVSSSGHYNDGIGMPQRLRLDALGNRLQAGGLNAGGELGAHFEMTSCEGVRKVNREAVARATAVPQGRPFRIISNWGADTRPCTSMWTGHWIWAVPGRNVTLGRQLPVAKGTAQRGTQCEPSAGSAPSTRRRNVSVLQLELAGTPQHSLHSQMFWPTQ